jgi:hypothetical protein
MVTGRNIDHRLWQIDQKKRIGAALGIKIALPIGLFLFIGILSNIPILRRRPIAT